MAGASGIARRGRVWGVQTPPIENTCVFYGLIIDKKTTFKLAFVQNQSTQCMCIHSQSHLLPIRFTICMNLLLRRAINIKFGHAKFCRKFSGRNTPPIDPHQRDFEPPPLQISGYATGRCDARPTVTFPAAGRHRPLAGTKLY